ncbi:MAG: carboxy terminal-processing peptidase [Kiritimatiellaeota bacterium]|nr:carboxy terminal-processing peptidase [Kiritimatiellota bacterium]
MKFISTSRRLAAGALGLAALLGVTAFQPLAPPAEPCKPAMIVAAALPQLHVSHRTFDARVATNALALFLNALDFDHTYFLASDIAEFQQQGSQLADQLRAGDVRFAFDVFNRLQLRVTNRVAGVARLLERGFDLNTRDTYHWKRKEAPWPADEKAWDELWRKKIQNDYLARIATLKLAEEQKARQPRPGLFRWGRPKDQKPEADEDAADPKLTPREFILKRYRQFQTVLQDSDAEWLLQRYLVSFTMAYDPHSEYFSPSTEEDFDINMRLSLVGIGAVLTPDDGAVKVERLMPGGPAERDGRLKPGDRIIAVAQGTNAPVDVLHWPLSKTVRLIRGQKNTTVMLTVIPAADLSQTKTRKIGLRREEIKLEEQRAKSEVRAVSVGPGVTRQLGIVTVPEFYADLKGQQQGQRDATSVARDIRKILGELNRSRVEGVVLDLRNNGGGSLEEAVTMTGEFIGSGPVVQVRQRDEVQILADTDPDIDYGGPLVLLVNRLSASASEILAAALQDYGRVIVVGDTKTHGKGTVQSLLPLGKPEDKLGALKVTTASFYRIAGGSTQLKGVTPDIVVPTTLDSMEIGEEYLPHALPWSVVDAAGFARQAALAPLIPELRRRSEARMAKDPQFDVHRQVLRRVADRLADQEISLNLKLRLAMAKADQELEKLQQQDEGVSGSPDQGKDPGKANGPDKKKNDPVLAETLRILSDLINLSATPQIARTAA